MRRQHFYWLQQREDIMYEAVKELQDAGACVDMISRILDSTDELDDELKKEFEAQVTYILRHLAEASYGLKGLDKMYDVLLDAKDDLAEDLEDDDGRTDAP